MRLPWSGQAPAARLFGSKAKAAIIFRIADQDHRWIMRPDAGEHDVHQCVAEPLFLPVGRYGNWSHQNKWLAGYGDWPALDTANYIFLLDQSKGQMVDKRHVLTEQIGCPAVPVGAERIIKQLFDIASIDAVQGN
jgi:hypothetical protein